MDDKSRALRRALGQLPRERAFAVVRACGLTGEEERCILEGLEGADLTWVSTVLHISRSSIDRRRASALRKICVYIGFV